MAALTTIALIAGAAASAAAAGSSVHASREAKREAKDNERDMKYQAGLENARLADKKKVEEAEVASRAARARQRAFSATKEGYASTFNTSPLGLAGNPFGGKDEFGA